MSNLDAIYRNLQRTGCLSGKTQKEEDDYYAFFANDRPKLLQGPHLMHAFDECIKLLKKSGRISISNLSHGLSKWARYHEQLDAGILRRTVGRPAGHQR